MRALIALACLLSTGVATPAVAGNPTPTRSTPSTASIEKLLEVTRARGMIDTSTEQIGSMMRNGMQQALQGETINEEQQQILDDWQAKLIAIIKEQLTWENFEPMMVDIYIRTYTQEEIDGMIAFYSTDVGRAMIAKQPRVMQAITEVTQSRMITMFPKIKALQDEMIERVKASHAQPAPQSPHAANSAESSSGH